MKRRQQWLNTTGEDAQLSSCHLELWSISWDKVSPTPALSPPGLTLRSSPSILKATSRTYQAIDDRRNALALKRKRGRTQRLQDAERAVTSLCWWHSDNHQNRLDAACQSSSMRGL